MAIATETTFDFRELGLHRGVQLALDVEPPTDSSRELAGNVGSWIAHELVCKAFRSGDTSDLTRMDMVALDVLEGMSSTPVETRLAVVDRMCSTVLDFVDNNIDPLRAELSLMHVKAFMNLSGVVKAFNGGVPNV